MRRRYCAFVFFGAVLGVATDIVIASSSKAKSATVEPLFLHRFSAVPSDRPGFRKYTGGTLRVAISGTLVGIVRPGQDPPAEAYGAVAIGHTMFYHTKDFAANGVAEGTSVLYVPLAMKLPGELLKP